MNRNDILEVTYDTCVELLAADRATLGETTSFVDDLQVDSLDLVEVVMALEDRFDVHIPEDDLKDVATIGEAADIVLARLNDPARV